jgi:hypothetical protein
MYDEFRLQKTAPCYESSESIVFFLHSRGLAITNTMSRKKQSQTESLPVPSAAPRLRTFGTVVL